MKTDNQRFRKWLGNSRHWTFHKALMICGLTIIFHSKLEMYWKYFQSSSILNFRIMMWGKCSHKQSKLSKREITKEHLNYILNALTLYFKLLVQWTKMLPSVYLNLLIFNISLETSYKQSNYKQNALSYRKEFWDMIMP